MLNYKWGSIEDVVVMVVSGTGDRTRQSTTVWASRIEKQRRKTGGKKKKEKKPRREFRQNFRSITKQNKKRKFSLPFPLIFSLSIRSETKENDSQFWELGATKQLRLKFVRALRHCHVFEKKNFFNSFPPPPPFFFCFVFSGCLESNWNHFGMNWNLKRRDERARTTHSPSDCNDYTRWADGFDTYVTHEKKRGGGTRKTSRRGTRFSHRIRRPKRK